MKPQLNTADSRVAVEFAPQVYWIGAMDPTLRTFDIILKTANGTSYNAYLVRGSEGVAIVDTVKENFSEEFFRRLESVADYSEIRAIVLNHLEPDHSGALPELMRCAPQAQLYISQRATSMLKGLLKPRGEAVSRQAETGELRQLLRDGRAEDAADVAHIAVVVATACLGSDHLWQDLGVWNRADLSDLLSLYFPGLAARNTADMKWKKFLYKQLCQSEGIHTCRAPSCEVCVDYQACFGPED